MNCIYKFAHVEDNMIIGTFIGCLWVGRSGFVIGVELGDGFVLGIKYIILIKCDAGIGAVSRSSQLEEIEIDNTFQRFFSITEVV